MPRITAEKKVWFDLPDDPDNGRVELRYLKDGDVQEVLNSVNVTETVFNKEAKSTLTRLRQIESPAIAQAAAAIVDWENHLDENGQQLKCTPENVRRFLQEDGYLMAINRLNNQLAEMVRAELRAAEKNA